MTLIASRKWLLIVDNWWLLLVSRGCEGAFIAKSCCSIGPLSDRYRAIVDPFSLRYRENCNRLQRYNFFWNSTICKLMDGYFAAGFPPLLPFPLNFVLPHIFPFVRFPFFTFSPSGVYLRPFVTLFTSLCSVTLFTPFCLSHFVYCACIWCRHRLCRP